MKILVIKEVCQGHAQCHAQVEDLFPLDDDGFVDLEGEVVVPAGREDEARRGTQACPERALSLIE